MNFLKAISQMSKIIVLAMISLLSNCSENNALVAKQPTLSDYTVGEKWTWKYKGVTNEGVVRSDGQDIREIVRLDGVLGMVTLFQ